jgi:hypothetical protein
VGLAKRRLFAVFHEKYKMEFVGRTRFELGNKVEREVARLSNLGMN